MKLSSIGIFLLTAMVAAKYIVSENSLTASDGSFKNGIVINYSDAFESLEFNTSQSSGTLLAQNYEPKLIPANKPDNVRPDSDNTSDLSDQQNNQPISFALNEVTIETTISMESSNSMVVYDFSNPTNNLISSTYEDIEDDIPLDQGNTVINGLMQVMPRR